jgi:hypothetical protein
MFAVPSDSTKFSILDGNNVEAVFHGDRQLPAT